MVPQAKSLLLDQSGSKFCVEPGIKVQLSLIWVKFQFANFLNSFLAWMPTWTSRWRRRRRRPKNSPNLARALIHHAQEPNIPFRNPSLRGIDRGASQSKWGIGIEISGCLLRVVIFCKKVLQSHFIAVWNHIPFSHKRKQALNGSSVCQIAWCRHVKSWGF